MSTNALSWPKKLNDRCRNPGSLPTPIKFPGSRQVLFLMSDVEAHILKFREIPAESEPPKQPAYRPRNVEASTTKSGARIGRPTNKSKMM